MPYPKHQGIYCHPAYLTYMQNIELDEEQAGIKIAGRNSNNLRYADDAILTLQCLSITSAGEDVEQRELSSTVSRNGRG